MATQQMAIDTL